MTSHTTSAMACVLITRRVIDTFIPLISKEKSTCRRKMTLKPMTTYSSMVVTKQEFPYLLN